MAADEAVRLPGPEHLRYRTEVLLRLEHHLYRPLLSVAGSLTGAVRRTQSGKVGHYVVYLLGVAVAGLAILAVGH